MGDSSITNSASGIRTNAMPDGYSTFRLNYPPPAPKDSQLVRAQMEQCMAVIGTETQARRDETEPMSAANTQGEDKSLKLKKKSSKPNKKSWNPNKKTTAYLIRSVRYQNLDKSFLKGLSEAHSHRASPRPHSLYLERRHLRLMVQGR
ncbi:hypothetical protein E4U31_008372 [Claviceps sp. LM219 group G6]|nr:hypothetical protein E4U15_008156 [Claviceps sp. LM218 group G6]KAG6107497.1 hypothetical protein E4U31_008372 [Claviceps sp. LM219 group G6]